MDLEPIEDPCFGWKKHVFTIKHRGKRWVLGIRYSDLLFAGSMPKKSSKHILPNGGEQW